MVESAPQKRFEIKQWNGVAVWSWDVKVDTCAICRSMIMEPCIDCQSNQKSASANDCIIVWGACNHAFHNHCISRWLKTKSSCPLDNSNWETQKYGK